MNTPYLYSIQDATRLMSVSRSSLYYLIAAGKIRPIKIGRRTLIPDQEIRRYVESLITLQDGMIAAGAGE